MMGKILAGTILLSALIAGVALYYLQVYAFYEEVQPDSEGAVVLTVLGGAERDAIVANEFQAIDSDSSPLRYRACFSTPHSQALLTETYQEYKNPVPLVAPGWFDCFDADEVGAALESGKALAFLGTENVTYGFDRIVAVSDEGRGYVWHQLNHCGKEVFDGKSVPAGCPLPPSAAQ